MGNYDDFEYEYKQWRKSGRITAYSNELPAKATYVDGHGFDNNPQFAAEGKALSNCAAIIGGALLILLFFETVGEATLRWILSRIGLDETSDVFSGSFSSTKLGVSLVYIFFGVIKYSIPIAILQLHCKLPRRIIYNRRTQDSPSKSLYFMLVFVILGLSTAASILLSDSGIPIGSFAESERFFAYSDALLLFFNAFFEIWLMPMLYAILVYGIILRLLRQFGERFSVIVVTIISSLMLHNYAEALPIILLSYFSAVCVLRCGSIFPVYWGRVFYRMLTFSIYYSRYVFPTPTNYMASFSIVLLCVAIGVGGCIYFYISDRSLYRPKGQLPAVNDDTRYLKMCLSPAFACSMVFALMLLLYDIVRLYI